MHFCDLILVGNRPMHICLIIDHITNGTGKLVVKHGFKVNHSKPMEDTFVKKRINLEQQSLNIFTIVLKDT